MSETPKIRKTHNPIARAIIEISFIIFLFYSNLLMGQFTAGQPAKTLRSALHDIITGQTVAIAIGSALIGYVVFEYLRGKS